MGQLEHVMPQRFQMMSNGFPNAMNGAAEVSHAACWEGGVAKLSTRHFIPATPTTLIIFATTFS